MSDYEVSHSRGDFTFRVKAPSASEAALLYDELAGEPGVNEVDGYRLSKAVEQAHHRGLADVVGRSMRL